MMADGLLILFAVLAVAGAVILIALVVLGDWSTRQLNRVGEIPQKVFIEFVQIVSGFAGVLITFVNANDKEFWRPTALVSFVCLAVWKLAQIMIDVRL